MKALYTDKDVEKLKDNIEAYFETEPEPGFSGLAYALGFCERRSLNDYAAKIDSPLSTPIKRAMLRIETDYEKLLREKACTGAIFALKNRGWSDKSEVEHSGGLKIKTEDMSKLTDAELAEIASKS